VSPQPENWSVFAADHALEEPVMKIKVPKNHQKKADVPKGRDRQANFGYRIQALRSLKM